ncbi:hypothetical protein KBTX_01521 [wastewater metagenome]|uniref:Alcohol dehydrogenase-like N-terminal domain-containing protein n=2 Tax=unclassified sequences TaxID=12908 RepID=A0A5B8RCR4_9ZZZZ|nr:zinc-dependent alcohol dehydrogenase family protein [Arhodomonas sp. KWT]QEA05202.1 hypothetical protein KBTEX_01521 [uncultured organism]
MKNASLRYRSFGPPLDTLELAETDVAPRPEGALRVAMSLAPVNPSDLIPVTGAYAHRIALPAVAGYEGVGVVVEAAPAYSGLIGRRVLPLRGAGTWQRLVDCDPRLAVPVPDDVDDLLAARAYINPLAATTLLRLWSVRGRRVLLTGAGSTCAALLGAWARFDGAVAVYGIHRSPGRAAGLAERGILPVSQDDHRTLDRLAAEVDLTFDALGGPLATRILGRMKPGSAFIGYGLLSGRPVAPSRSNRARLHRFHLRDELAVMDAATWQQAFRGLWPRLRQTALPEPSRFALAQWRDAIRHFSIPGTTKPLIRFGVTDRGP